MLVVVKAMKNPRSALCKTSIMAASDIFNAFGEKVLDSGAFDQLVGTQLAQLSFSFQDSIFCFQVLEMVLNLLWVCSYCSCY